MLYAAWGTVVREREARLSRPIIPTDIIQSVFLLVIYPRTLLRSLDADLDDRRGGKTRRDDIKGNPRRTRFRSVPHETTHTLDAPFLAQFLLPTSSIPISQNIPSPTPF